MTITNWSVKGVRPLLVFLSAIYSLLWFFVCGSSSSEGQKIIHNQWGQTRLISVSKMGYDHFKY